MPRTTPRGEPNKPPKISANGRVNRKYTELATTPIMIYPRTWEQRVAIVEAAKADGRGLSNFILTVLDAVIASAEVLDRTVGSLLHLPPVELEEAAKMGAEVVENRLLEAQAAREAARPERIRPPLPRFLRKPTHRRRRSAADLAEMLRRRAAGESLQEIGESYGISRERVRQILKEMEPNEAA